MSENNIELLLTEDETKSALELSEMFERDARRYNRPFFEEQEVSTE